MKRVMKTFHRVISAMLVAAMIITLTPETVYKVNAAETETERLEAVAEVQETETEAALVETAETEAEKLAAEAGTENPGAEAQETETGDITAEEKTKYHAVFTFPDNATVSVEGTALTTGNCDREYAEGEEVHFAVVPADGYKITGVTYNTGGEDCKACFDEDDNTYFFVITAATEVKVGTTALAKGKMTFSGNELSGVTVTKRNGTVLKNPAELTVTSGVQCADTEDAWEGTEISFQLILDSGYEAETVSYGEEILEPASDGTYTLTVGEGIGTVPEESGIEVTAKRKIDSYSHQLTFVTERGGYYYTTGGHYTQTEDPDVYVTDSDSIKFHVGIIETGYEISEVTAGDSRAGITRDGEWYIYTFAPSENGKKVSDTVTIKTKPVTASGEKQFYFDEADNVTVAVTTKGVTYDKTTGFYTIPYQAASGKDPAVTIDEVEFQVTASSVVDEIRVQTDKGSYEASSEPTIVQTGMTTSGGKTTCTFKIVTDTLYPVAEANKIRITTHRNICELAFSGGKPVSVKTVDKNYEYTAEEDEGTFYYYISKRYTAIVELPENTEAYEVVNGVTSGEPVALDAKNKFSMVVTKSVKYVLKSTLPDYMITTDPADLSERIPAGTTVTASVKKSVDQTAVHSFRTEVTGDGVKSAAAINSDGNVEIGISGEDAGKDFSVNIYVREVNDGRYKTVLAGTVPVSVEKAVVSVKYAQKSISQTVDTEADYTLKVTPDSVSEKALTVAVSEELASAGTRAVITKTTEKGKSAFKLNVTAGTRESAGVIRIYDTALAEADRTEQNALCSIPVTVKNADLTIASVKTTKLTHYSAFLSVKSKNKLNTEGNLSYCYEIKVTPLSEENNAADQGGYDTYQYFPYESQTQAFEVQLGSPETSMEPCDYQLEIKLIQPSGKAVDGAEAVSNTNASEEKKLTVTTKTPYYEDKLSLTKKTTSIYRGQSDVTVAVAKFSGKATYLKEATVEVYNTDGTLYEGLGSGYADSMLTARIGDNGAVIVSAGSNVPAKKFKLKVTPKAEEDMYAAPATITVKVEKSIDSVYITGSSKVYKPANKAAVYKPTYGAAPYNAKTKKFTYSLYADKDCETELTGEMARYVSVDKKGKVTIAKGYQATADAADNTFYLKAQAADYEGNDTRSVQPVVITPEAVEIAEVYLADNSFPYEKVSKSEFTTKELEDLCVIAKDQNGNVIDPDVLKYKSSSNAVCVYDYDDNCYTGNIKTAKNVTITVTTADGGKKSKKTAKFSIVYAKPKTLDLAEIKVYSGYSYVCPAADPEDETRYSYDVSASDNVSIDFYIRADGSEEDIDDYLGLCDYSVSVKGGKLDEYRYSGKCSVIPTAKVTTITLKDKANKVTKRYVFTNTGYLTAKAPAVKLSSVNGRKTTKLYCGEGEILGMTFKVNSSSYDHVLVHGAVNGIYPIDADGYVTILQPLYDSACRITLYMTFGTEDEQNQFVPQTKTRAVKLKINAQPKPKIVSSYKLKAEAGSQAELQIKNGQLNGTTLGFMDAKLLNANVNGQPNEFTTYFDIGTAEDGSKCIRLKEGLSSEKIAAIKKKDMTGYITHTVYNNVTVTEKITIKFSSK